MNCDIIIEKNSDMGIKDLQEVWDYLDTLKKENQKELLSLDMRDEAKLMQLAKKYLKEIDKIDGLQRKLEQEMAKKADGVEQFRKGQENALDIVLRLLTDDKFSKTAEMMMEMDKKQIAELNKMLEEKI